MAKILVDEKGIKYLSGSVGESITFSKWKGIHVMRQKVPKGRFKNREHNKFFTRCSKRLASMWEEIGDDGRENYNARAKEGIAHSGYGLFCKENFRKVMEEERRNG